MGYLKKEQKGQGGFGTYYRNPGTADDMRGYFGFIKSFYNYNFEPEEVETDEGLNGSVTRCDSEETRVQPIPSGLHKSNLETGVCDLCGSNEPVYPTTNSHIVSLSNIRDFRAPVQGYKGFIVYIRLKNKDLEDQEFYNYNENVGKTLQEIFRLMLEWEWCYKNLDCRDTYSVLAYEMLEELQMPQSIREWLWQEVPDQRVAKFLKGVPNARDRGDLTLIPAMSIEFDSWCWYHIVSKPPLWGTDSK